MCLQKWLALCYAIKDHTGRAAVIGRFTQVHWDNVFKALLIMHADGMSSEDSEIPPLGGTLLRRRTAAWRSKMLQDFLMHIRSHLKHVTHVAYEAQDQPLLSRRPAPAGLTANFYDEAYVNGLSIAARA